MLLHDIQRLNLQRIHHDFLDNQSGDFYSQIIRKTKSPCSARIDKEEGGEGRFVLTFFRLSLNWKGMLNDSQKEPILKVPLCHLFKVDGNDDNIITLSYVRILHKRSLKTGWIKAHRMLLELEFNDSDEALLFKASIFSHLSPLFFNNNANVYPKKKRVLVIYNEQSGTSGNSQKVITNVVCPLLDAANISYGLLSTQYALHAKLVGNRVTFVHNTIDDSSPHIECRYHYDGIIIVGGDGLIHEVINGLMSRHSDWYNKNSLLSTIPSGTSNALARNLGISCPIWACWVIMREFGYLSGGSACSPSFYSMPQRGQRKHLGIMVIDQDQGQESNEDRRFYSHLSITYGLLADIDLGGDQYRWMGRDRLKWVAMKKISTLTTYSNVCIKYLPFIKDQIHPFDLKSKRPTFRLRNELVNSTHSKKIETSLFNLMALKQSYIDRDLVVDTRMYERDSIEDEDSGIDLFIINGKKQRTLISKALLQGDLTPLNDLSSSNIRASCLEISFPPPPTVKNNTDGLLSIDGEGFTPSSIYVESIPNIIPFICSGNYLDELSFTSWYLGMEKRFTKNEWEDMYNSLSSPFLSSNNQSLLSSNSFFCCLK